MLVSEEKSLDTLFLLLLSLRGTYLNYNCSRQIVCRRLSLSSIVLRSSCPTQSSHYFVSSGPPTTHNVHFWGQITHKTQRERNHSPAWLTTEEASLFDAYRLFGHLRLSLPLHHFGAALRFVLLPVPRRRSLTHNIIHNSCRPFDRLTLPSRHSVHLISSPVRQQSLSGDKEQLVSPTESLPTLEVLERHRRRRQ